MSTPQVILCKYFNLTSCLSGSPSVSRIKCFKCPEEFTVPQDMNILKNKMSHENINGHIVHGILIRSWIVKKYVWSIRIYCIAQIGYMNLDICQNSQNCTQKKIPLLYDIFK